MVDYIARDYGLKMFYNITRYPNIIDFLENTEFKTLEDIDKKLVVFRLNGGA